MDRFSGSLIGSSYRPAHRPTRGHEPRTAHSSKPHAPESYAPVFQGPMALRFEGLGSGRPTSRSAAGPAQ